VPILTHAARSNGFQDGFDDLAAPTAWRRVLEEYPTLRVCFGHVGHFHGVGGDAAQPSLTSWPHRFMELMDEYPNVYADVGNSKYAVDAAYRTKYDTFLRALLGPLGSADPVVVKRRKRLMFGSDYWMNTLGPDHAGFLDLFSSGIETLLGPTVRAWFMGANALRWLGITGEDDLRDVTNLNRQRLVAFYGAQPRPDWLVD
jgi:predicted TIM-barrel fold metal-dependent hydrolase